MTPVVAVIARLRDAAPLTALVSTRVVNQHLGQNPTLPCVVAFEVDAFNGQHLRGPDGLGRARVQVESRAATKPVVDAVAAAVHGDGLGPNASGLFGWMGSVGSPSFDIVNVEDAGRRAGYDADELRQYWVQRDYIVKYRGVA